MMTDATAEDVEETPKPKGKPFILLGLMALLGAGGGFGAAFMGVIPGLSQPAVEEVEAKPDLSAITNHAYVSVPVMTLSLTGSSEFRLLRIMAELEVHPEAETAVADVMPRIMDVMNSYLRALDTEEVVAPYALQDVRRQLLRRVQVVTGPDMVNDLLITEFLLN